MWSKNTPFIISLFIYWAIKSVNTNYSKSSIQKYWKCVTFPTASAMYGKVDTRWQLFLNNNFVLDFVSVHKCLSRIDRFAVKLLITGVKIFLKKDWGEKNT